MDTDRLTGVLGQTRGKVLASICQHEHLRKALEPILVVQEMLELVLRQLILESEGRAKIRPTALGQILIAKGVLTAAELTAHESELETLSTADKALEHVLQAQREWLDRLLAQISHDDEDKSRTRGAA